MRLPVLSRLAAAVFMLTAIGGAAEAEEARRPAGVVELFTSQGCSSCPPADAFLAELARSGEVVALAYHVDYWDYLGWRDTMGNPENTRRQRDYARSFGTKSVYTPQAVVSGRSHVNGAKRKKVWKALRDTGGLEIDVKISRLGDRIVIDAGDAAGPAPDANVLLVYFAAPTEVNVGRGENGGRRIAYWNAVTELQVAGMWHGKAARFELPAKEVAKKGSGGCAVLLQRTDENGLPGAIIGAAILQDRTM